MNPLLEIWLIVQRELRKNFRSIKGIALLAMSLLGGTAATLLLVKIQEFKKEDLGNPTPEQMIEAREHLLERAYSDSAMAKYLAQAPEVLFAVLKLTIWLTPLLVALIGFDAISGELQHKSVRYMTVRARRTSIFFGKFFGLWTSVSAITLTMHALIWMVCIVRGEATAGTAISWGLRFWLTTLPISAAWCGIAMLIGSLFKTPILSLLLIMTAFFVLWLFEAIGWVSGNEVLEYVYPNYWDKWLLSPRVDRSMSGLGVCALFALGTMAAGTVLFQKRDV